MTAPNDRRSAFTLVELLVAIGIIVALVLLALAFWPRRDVRLAADGAAQLQTYLASAKSRAIRDRAPRGVRLLPGADGTYREAQYVEVPEPYRPPAEVPVAGGPPKPVYLFAQAGSTTVYVWGYDVTGTVLAGDMLELVEGNSIHRVVEDPTYDPTIDASTVRLASVPERAKTQPYRTSEHYRFVRQPRPLMGEPALQLPAGVLVEPDATAGGRSLNVPRSWSGAHAEIIFTPSGEVLNAVGGRVVLWVRHESGAAPPTLLTIYARTGGVAAHPEGPAGNPYQFTQDGRSSGQ